MEWKVCFPGYEVSTSGLVRKLACGSPVPLCWTGNDRNYISVFLRVRKGLRKCIKVHRLVAEAFIPNPMNFKEVNHINGVASDNRVENLEWCNGSHNIQHAFCMGLKKTKITFAQAQEMRELYKTGNVTQSALAKTYGVSPSTVYSVLINHIYKPEAYLPYNESKTA